MRIISGTELHQDLISKLPVASANFVPSITEDNRATYLSYFKQFIKIIWKEEPTPKHSLLLCRTLSQHLNVEVSESELIQQTGDLIEVGIENKPAKELAFRFPCSISNELSSVLNEAVVGGVILKRYQTNNGVINSYLDGPQEMFTKVEKYLSTDPALKLLEDQPDQPIFAQYRSGASNLTLSSLARQLLQDTVEFKSASFAIQRMNEYLLTDTTTLRIVIAVDGFSISEQTELVDGVFIAPISTVEHLEGWNRLFGPESYSFLNHNPQRFPSAVIFTDQKVRRFFRWGIPDPNQSAVDLNVCLMLLPLFGPSPIAPITNFSESIDIEYRTGGFSFGHYGSEFGSFFYSIPFEPDLTEFAKLYNKFIALQGKSESRVRIALQRLLNCLRKSNLTDKSIELGIALESILLSGTDDDGTSGEITFRLASRGAWFLGKSAEERRHIFNVLKAAYKLRSKAAHEGQAPEVVKSVHKGSEPLATAYLIQDALEICSEVIKKVIDKQEIPDWTEIILGTD
jgi:Apea-like HEPN